MNQGPALACSRLEPNAIAIREKQKKRPFYLERNAHNQTLLLRLIGVMLLPAFRNSCLSFPEFFMHFWYVPG